MDNNKTQGGDTSNNESSDLAAKAPAAQADPERAKWTTKQWYEHVGAWETPEGFISFGSVMALGAMLIQFQRAFAASTASTPEAAQADKKENK